MNLLLALHCLLRQAATDPGLEGERAYGEAQHREGRGQK